MFIPETQKSLETKALGYLGHTYVTQSLKTSNDLLSLQNRPKSLHIKAIYVIIYQLTTTYYREAKQNFNYNYEIIILILIILIIIYVSL